MVKTLTLPGRLTNPREYIHDTNMNAVKCCDGYGLRMLRPFTVLVGLGMMSYGGWLLRVESSTNAACNGTSITGNSVTGTTGVSCVNVAWVYFGSFVLVVAGFVATAIGMIALRRAARNRVVAKQKPSLREEWESTHRPASPSQSPHQDASKHK